MITAAPAVPQPSRLSALMRSALVAGLLLASLPLSAQSPQQPEPQPQQQPTTESSENTTVADTPPLPDADTGEAATTEPEDPFDYEASEQISEDLSVSFPVDI